MARADSYSRVLDILAAEAGHGARLLGAPSVVDPPGNCFDGEPGQEQQQRHHRDYADDPQPRAENEGGAEGAVRL